MYVCLGMRERERVSFLMAVISPPSYFSMLSSSRYIDVSTLSSMLVSPLPPSFLDIYSLSTLSLLFSYINAIHWKRKGVKKN